MFALNALLFFRSYKNILQSGETLVVEENAVLWEPENTSISLTFGFTCHYVMMIQYIYDQKKPNLPVQVDQRRRILDNYIKVSKDYA